MKKTKLIKVELESKFKLSFSDTILYIHRKHEWFNDGLNCFYINYYGEVLSSVMVTWLGME